MCGNVPSLLSNPLTLPFPLDRSGVSFDLDLINGPSPYHTFLPSCGTGRTSPVPVFGQLSVPVPVTPQTERKKSTSLSTNSLLRYVPPNERPTLEISVVGDSSRSHARSRKGYRNRVSPVEPPSTGLDLLLSGVTEDNNDLAVHGDFTSRSDRDRRSLSRAIESVDPGVDESGLPLHDCRRWREGLPVSADRTKWAERNGGGGTGREEGRTVTGVIGFPTRHTGATVTRNTGSGGGRGSGGFIGAEPTLLEGVSSRFGFVKDSVWTQFGHGTLRPVHWKGE